MLRNAAGGGERIYLLKDGVYSPVIGGFEKKGFNNKGTVIIDSHVLVRVNERQVAATAATILSFDVTNLQRIGMIYTRVASAPGGMGFVLLSDSVVNGNWATSFPNKTSLTFSEENGYKVADVSTITGNKYLSFIVNKWERFIEYSYDVSEIWIE